MQSSTDLCAFYTIMIKILQIIIVVASILTGYFVVHTVNYVVNGVGSDERVDEFLKLPSVREKFEGVAGNKAKPGESRVSPLVEQAEAFALILNPLKPTIQKTAKGAKPASISSRLPVTPKFKVFGTSYCAGNPELSQVLIDEPGRDRRWVRQSSMVGHLLIEQVKDGIVVVKSSEKTFEIPIEEKPQTSIRDISSSISRQKSSPSRGRPLLPYSSKVAAGGRKPISTTRKLGTSKGNEGKMGELVNKLKDLQRDSKSGKTDQGLDSEERTARIQELISKFKSTRVSAEEAKKLGNLGEELKGIRKDTKPSPPEADKGKVEVSPPKPDKAAEK